MYMAKAVLEGIVPYKDFFFASPPLQIYLIAIIKFFTGNNLLLLKLIPIFATLGSAFFIFKFMQKKFGNLEGIVASTLYLFSFLILLTTDYMTGIHLTTFFIFGMIYFLEFDSPFIAGIFASFALLTRLYAPFPIAGALVYLWIYKKKQILKFLGGTSIFFIPASLFFDAISSGGYLNQIFFFRLKLISGIGLSKFSVISFFILGDLFLILGSTLYIFFDKEKNKLALPILATLFSIILYLVYSDIYYLYFGLIIGFLAIFTTKIIFEFKDLKSFKKVLGIILIFVVLINSLIYVTNYGSTSNIPFHKDISDFVKNNSLDNETISGSFEIAHLVALESGRNLAGNLIDTNPKNIITNEFKISDVVEKINGVRFMIVKGYLLQNGELINVDQSIPMDFIKQNCKEIKRYTVVNDLNGANAVMVYDCKKKN